jgi:hypothetical protein
MKFVHRLGYYLVGLLVGILFLFFFFKNKRTEFCYMPNCRVLKNIRSKPLTFSKEVKAKFDAQTFVLDDVKHCTENGEVNFSQSNKPYKGGGKIYTIEGQSTTGEDIVVEVVNFDDKALLLDINKLKN